MISSSAYLICPTLPHHSFHAVDVITELLTCSFAGLCPGPYLTLTNLLLLTSPQPLHDSNSILPFAWWGPLGSEGMCVCVRACEGHKEGHVSAEPTDKAGAVAGAPGGAAVHLTCCTGTLTLRHIWQLDQGLSEWHWDWWLLATILLI